MRFTVIGHACLYIETGRETGDGGPTILVDPWLSGSCFWRSWWHYPPLQVEPGWLEPDYIYITHHHFDHMHYPTLRRLAKSATVMMAKVGVDVMPAEVRGLGFEKILELPHGEPFELAPGVEVASFQYGFDDSAFLVRDGESVLCDMNDSKVRGRALAQLKRCFGPPTFMLKGHSYAITYPLCYEAEDPEELALVPREVFSQEFIATARDLDVKYAVPFASAVAFLHPEAMDHNRHQVSPPEIARNFAADPRVSDIELVQMMPGDSWSSEDGFSLTDEDWYADRDARLKQLQAEVMPKIEKSLEEEKQIPLHFDVFEAHLKKVIASFPPFVGRVLLSRAMVFEVPSSAPDVYWVVECGQRRVYRTSTLPEGWASLWRISEGVLADAISKDLLSFIVGTMRSRVSLAKGGVSTDLAFWGLVMMHDQGYLPISKVLFSARFWSALWRRRREAVDQIEGLLSGGGSVLKRLSSGFTNREAGSAARPASPGSDR